MKVACIYFPISSVGGIASEARAYKLAAIEAGDTFDVIRCPNSIQMKTPKIYPTPQLQRGGDTFISVDGECSHHYKHVGKTCRWLENNYDALFISHPCPHPTKAYGQTPRWTPIYEDCKLPKAVKFMDAYVSTYKWIIPALEFVDHIYVNQPAYQLSLEAVGITGSVLRPKPFHPGTRPPLDKHEERLTIWPNQWKDIKGIKPFMEQVPEIAKYSHIELYSNGIRYYQIRKDNPDLWERCIQEDFFKDEKFQGDADFYGYVTPAEMTKAFQRAWCSVNLQGLSARVKHSYYREGSYNNTEVEALYWGTWPIVAEQVLKSPIPSECLIPISDSTKLAEAIEISVDQPLAGSAEGAIAREWVEDVHGAGILWAQIMDDFRE